MAAVDPVQRADELGVVQQRIELLRLRRRDQMRLHAEIPGTGMHELEIVEDLVGGGDHHVAGGMDAAALAGDRLDLAVEIDRVFLQLGDVGVGVVGVDAGRGVPGRARGQLVLLEQGDVGPAELGQVVEHAGPDDAAADHRDPDLRLHAKAPFDAPPPRTRARRRQ